MYYRLATIGTYPSFNKASAFARRQARSSLNVHVVLRNTAGGFDVCHKSHCPIDAFHFFAVRCGAIRRNDDMGGLRTRCFQYGLSPRGWRFLNEHGSNACEPSMLHDLDDSIKFQASMCYIEWQAQSGISNPLPVELGAKFLILSDVIHPAELDIDPRLARAAYDYLQKIDNSEQRSFFVETEWMEVLFWMRDQRPTLDRNQWRAGWPSIARAHKRWLLLNQDRVNWNPVLEPLSKGDWKIIPLTNSFEVALEGIRMKHCVATYIEECSAGDYLLFSLRDLFIDMPRATAGLARIEGRWCIDQVRGKCNADPDADLLSVAKEIQELVNRASNNGSRRCLPLGDFVEEMKLPNSHKTLLNSPRYLVRNVREQFSVTDATWLGDYANWLEALASGGIEPLTTEQEGFVSSVGGKHRPHGKYEKIWDRYQRIRSLDEARAKHLANSHLSESRRQRSMISNSESDYRLDELLNRCEACGVSVNLCRCYDL